MTIARIRAIFYAWEVNSIPDFKELYFLLFAAMSDAVEQIEAANYGAAKDVLIAAQQNAEDIYISDET